MYQQSRTEKERDQCFDPKVLDRLRTKNFNEVIHLNMDPENDKLFANHKILQSFKGNIVLEGENKPFSKKFYQKFLRLIDRIQGNLLLTFVDVKEFGNRYAKKCAQTLERKLLRGEKVFVVNFCVSISSLHSHAWEISNRHWKTEITIFLAMDWELYLQNGTHDVQFQKISNMRANFDTMIAMISQDRFAETKQYLARLLPVVTNALSRDGRRWVECGSCGSIGGDSMFDFNLICFLMEEPAWSNCAGCALKI